MAGKNTGTNTPDTPRVPLFLRAALFFLLVCLNALVAKFVVFSLPLAPGISLLYVVVALMIVTTLWFGMYGAVAAYVGCFIGAGVLSGLSPEVSLYWSIADFLQVLIPLLAFRMLGGDISIRTRRDVAILVVFGIVLNNVVGAIWGTLSLYFAGLVPAQKFPVVFFGWLIMNIIISVIVVPLVLRFGTPLIRDHELFVKKYWE